MKTFFMLTMALVLMAAVPSAQAKNDLKLIYFDGHIHTTHSDGSGSIADVKQVAKERGLNAVIITNHTKQIADMNEWNDIVGQCRTLSEKEFLMIPAFEVTGSEGLFCRDHVLAWGVDTPFVGEPADALAPEEVWESPENPFGTGPMAPEVIRQWTDWIHENRGIAVHAHTTGTTQLGYNVDYIEVINLSHTKDVARFAQMAGFSAGEAWNLGVLFNSFAIFGDEYLQLPIDMPNPYYGQPGQPMTIQLPLQQALYMGTSLIGDMGENSGGAQWLGTPTPQTLLDQGATPAAPLNSWDDLLLAYIDGKIDHPIFGVANSDAHNTANIIIGSTGNDDSDVGEAKNGVYLHKFNKFQFAKAIRRGNLFATTGPSLYFDVNGEIMGETVQLGHKKNKKVKLNLRVNSENPAATLAVVSIIKNGEILFREEPMSPTYELELEDTVTGNGYYRVEVTSMDISDGRPRFAFGNPVFVKLACSKGTKP
ncbi:MAG: hypothetical protein V2B19_23275 [Pseudomonadota bacterium]